MKEKRKILLSILGIMLLVLVTVGVTFAVFTYTKLGTTENTVTTGTLKFLYTENTGVGNGINIENAFPVSDEVGKGYNTDKYVFDFSIEATNSGVEEIPYEVTLRKKNTSTLLGSNIKVYLTDMTEDSDTAIVTPTLYSDLNQTIIDVGEETEKTVYNGTVLGGELTYKKDFRLRMWIDEKCNQDDINGKSFTATVNVYSNVPLVSEEELNLRNSTEISAFNINGGLVEKVDGEDYDYEITLPEGTTTATLDFETQNDNSTVKIEKIDSLSYFESNMIRLATSNTFNLNSGINYFKITVTSENKQKITEYILKVKVIQGVDTSSSYTLTTTFDNSPSIVTGDAYAGGGSGVSKSKSKTGQTSLIPVWKDMNGDDGYLTSITIPTSLTYYSDGSSRNSVTVYLLDQDGNQLDSITQSHNGNGKNTKTYNIQFTVSNYLDKITDGFIINVSTSAYNKNANTATPGVSYSNVTVSDPILTYSPLLFE